MSSEERINVEYQEKWREVADHIPFVDIRQGYSIQIVPPFGGAMIRFRIRHKQSLSEYSVYYDTQDALGIVGKAYYEVYPIDGDVFRSFHLEEILIKIYEQNESIEVLRKELPEGYV